jgi:hypothetical protein
MQGGVILSGKQKRLSLALCCEFLFLAGVNSAILFRCLNIGCRAGPTWHMYYTTSTWAQGGPHTCAHIIHTHYYTTLVS